MFRSVQGVGSAGEEGCHSGRDWRAPRLGWRLTLILLETVRSAISLRPWANANISGRHNNDGMPEHQVAFTVGVIALGAKMAKADGIVTRDEVLAFKEVFKVPEGLFQPTRRMSAFRGKADIPQWFN